MEHEKRLSFAEKLYQRSIWHEVESVALKARLRRPIVVELDPTTYCNFTCPECISNSNLNSVSFTSDRLVSLIQEFIQVGVKALIFIGGGEPLAHPAIGYAIQELGEHGISIGVVTNGIFVDRYKEILAKYAQWVRVSVDAATPETYSLFRPHRSSRNQFYHVINNMREFSSLKKGSLGFSFLLMNRRDYLGNVIASNYHEVLTAGLIAKDIGCDYFQVKPMYDSRHFLLPQPDSLLKPLKNQIKELYDLKSDEFGIISSSTLDVTLNHGPFIEPKTYDRCLISELRTLITPHGAYICPYYRGTSSKCYGNVNQMSFSELWLSPNRQSVMESTRPSKECLFHCIRNISNLELISLAKKHEKSNILNDYDLFI